MMLPLDELKQLQATASRARVPLYQYLGGPTRRRIRTLNPLAGERRDAGGKRVYLLEAAQGAGRQAAGLAGTAHDFAMRCPKEMGGAAALKLAREIEPHAPQWISHPDPAVLRRIAAQTTVPVAVTAGHLDLLRDETADLLLLDLPALGVRQAMALAALAETHYVGVGLTGCLQDPWRSAGLHLAAALPNFIAIEAGELPLDQDGFAELPR